MSESYRPHLVVTVDTEEDNWIPARDGITVENINELPVLQELLEEFDVPPTYLVTYQVARDPGAAELLGGLAGEGRAEIGAHLHPWNTPPHPEAMMLENFSLRNLSRESQGLKIASLCSCIRDHLDVSPVSFRAGRWSLSRACVGPLLQEGIRVDSSVLPYMYWHDVPGSPSYSRAPVRPYRLSPGGDLQRHHPDGALLEVPATAGYTRGSWRLWGPVDRLFRSLPLVPLHIPGLLARAGVIERIALTPEQTPLDKMLRLTEAAVERRLPVLNLFLHSTSLLPGATSFVPSSSERERLLERIRRYLDAVISEHQARPVRLGELSGMACR
jgi:hypothetical protein